MSSLQQPLLVDELVELPERQLDGQLAAVDAVVRQLAVHAVAATQQKLDGWPRSSPWQLDRPWPRPN